MKKQQPQNAWGSNQKTTDEKEAPPKYNGLKSKTSDEKEATQNARG
jgi:hypothetical protein